MCQVFSSTVPCEEKKKKIPSFFEFFFKIFSRNFFLNFFLDSGKSHSAEKCRRGPLGVFEHPFFCKIGKNEAGPFGDIKKICEKKSHQAKKNLHKKFLVISRTPTYLLLLGRHQKLSYSTSMLSGSRSYKCGS